MKAVPDEEMHSPATWPRPPANLPQLAPTHSSRAAMTKRDASPPAALDASRGSEPDGSPRAGSDAPGVTGGTPRVCA